MPAEGIEDGDFNRAEKRIAFRAARIVWGRCERNASAKRDNVGPMRATATDLVGEQRGAQLIEGCCRRFAVT